MGSAPVRKDWLTRLASQIRRGGKTNAAGSRKVT